MKTCFLFGHRDAPAGLEIAIISAMEDQYVRLGVTQFIMGHYGDFDRMAIAAGRAVKKLHPEISLLLLLPYHPAERPVETPRDFDGTFYPPGMETVPRRLAIVRANQYMIHDADTVLCYVKRPGNTRTLLEQAERRAKNGELEVRNLANPI